MTEDREQTSGEDREQNVEDVEGHGYIGQTAGQQVGQQVGQQIGATDDDDPDVEGHSFIGQTAGQQIGANTPEPSDQQTG